MPPRWAEEVPDFGKNKKYIAKANRQGKRKDEQSFSWHSWVKGLVLADVRILVSTVQKAIREPFCCAILRLRLRSCAVGRLPTFQFLVRDCRTIGKNMTNSQPVTQRL